MSLCNSDSDSKVWKKEDMKKLLALGPAFIIFAAFLWSIDGLLRRSLYVLPPAVIVFYEHLIGFTLLIPFLIPHRKIITKIKPKAWGALFWVTLLGSILGTIFYTAALGKVNYIQFSVVILLQQLQPLFAVFFAWLVLKERLEKSFPILLLLSLVGAYMVSFPNLTVNLHNQSGEVIAALLAIGAAFAWGSSTAFGRYALLQIPTILVTGIRFGLACILGLAFVFGLNQQQYLGSISQLQFLTLLGISLSTGMVALAIYYYGLKRTPAHISAICELTWPISAVVIDYVFFHTRLTITQILGALVLAFCIYRVTRFTSKAKQASVQG